MHRAEAEAWLDKEDKVCREGRRDRLDWVARLMPVAEYLTFPGGWMAKHLFEEARYCFVYGQFLATIVLGMASFLLREAVENGWLSQEEFKNLDHARTLRNPIAHFRRPLHEDTVESRSVTLNELPYSIIEDDARHVMVTAFRVLARQTV